MRGKIKEKIGKIIKEPIISTYYFGRIVMGIVGLFFILFGLVVFLASWWRIIDFFYFVRSGELIQLFVTIAEYYLISITFVIVGRSVIAFAQAVEIEPKDIGKLKEYLIAMLVSISGVVFINMILKYEEPAELNINILYVGLAIASVVVALGVYIKLSGEKGGKEKKMEVEKREGEKGIIPEVQLSEPPKKEEE